MTAVLQRYRVLIIITIFTLLTASILWFVFSKQNTNKIPSRGVFVIQQGTTDFA